MFSYLTGSNRIHDEFRRLEDELDQLFGGRPLGIRSVARGSFPPINLGATPEQVDVYVYAAGIDPASCNVTVHNNVLTIEGERKPVVEEPENARYYRHERFSGGFHRAVTLPEDVDAGKVDAKYRNGVLHITLQRKETSRPRQIQVQ